MKIELGRFQMSLLGAFAKNVITVSQKPVYTFVDNHVLLVDLERNYTDFFAVFGKQTFSGLGKPVYDADLFRDEPLRGIKSILRGFAKISGFQYRQDALDLLKIFENLGDDIDKLNYNAENESVDKLIAEFDKPENAAKLVHLNLTDLYATLKTRHAAFVALYLQQTESNAELRQQESASALRSKLIASLRNYLNVVTAMKSVEGWSGLYAELVELSKAANNSVNSQDKDEPQTT